MAEQEEPKLKFAIGDKVRHRCGGPVMVVVFDSSGSSIPPQYDCSWFSEQAGEFKRERLLECVLEAAESPSVLVQRDMQGSDRTLE